jgi:hypothetical protein
MARPKGLLISKKRPKRAPARRTNKRAARRGPRRTLNGIPLKRKVMWVYDTESSEFKALVRAELNDIKVQDAERDGIDFIEAVLADPEVQKWWR